jgi:hypothetical protein
MARQTVDPAVLAHLEWLGFVRPNGLVVSPTALVRAGAILERGDSEGRWLLKECVQEREFAAGEAPAPYVADFPRFATAVLGWSFSPRAYSGTTEAPIPSGLVIALPEYGETLRPDYAVREMEPRQGASPWQLLVQVLEAGHDFDQPVRGEGQLDASAHSRLERLLRETYVEAGLLCNGRSLRLISAPRGESSGWIDFQVADMVQPAGRPISTALRLLLSERRLLALPRHQRLAALLADSRTFQNEVSDRLAEQVLHALYELLRGFQAAHNASDGRLLREPLADDPDEVYRALLTVILRFVFILFAEERSMLPDEPTFVRFYSLGGLYERLRVDAALNPDTMSQRFGAWAQLVAVFRMIHDGASAGPMELPDRHGSLFDPDRFPFLEGRRGGGARQVHERIDVPLVPDGNIYRALEKLLVLDGERISYRALDVEQIGSVYETMMGFGLHTAEGPSVAIRPAKKEGAPPAVDLDALLAEPGPKRARWVRDRADRKVTSAVGRALTEAASVEDLHAALAPVIDRAATPDLAPSGAMLLQPSEARRRSGSHYTPRMLTRPIVKTALEPVLARLRGEDGLPPRPEQILDLKVCDPAMGSGAFLVEACRQLGDALVESWHAHGKTPVLPPDENEVIYARRLVAQRCLYGVDRNPVAVDLAKVSLWLVTLASDHPLTFLDHALRHGDSLVGLSRHQIEAFHWNEASPIFQAGFETLRVREHLKRVTELRRAIREAGEAVSDEELRALWEAVESETSVVRLAGDLVLSAFFEEEKPKEREARRLALGADVVNDRAERHRGWLEEMRHADRPLAPFHWEVEFPEVFSRGNPGFDAIVGNPPFAGKNSVGSSNVPGYLDWLKIAHEESHGNSDLVAHFFRRAFDVVRRDGVVGLIATNTISQGDTRSTGLRWICNHGGEIFQARKRYKWPAKAAVVVSVIHLIKGKFPGPKLLDDHKVDRITAFLFDQGGCEDPARLVANADKSFVGSYVLGMGFTFDDSDTDGVASSLAEMERLEAKNPANTEVVFPYIGGDEVNSSPTHSCHRYVIDFGEKPADECWAKWPELMAIVEEKVKPRRQSQASIVNPARWWMFARPASRLRDVSTGLGRVLVVARVGQQAAFAFLPSETVFSEQLIIFPIAHYAAFCSLQARPHEVWARFFGSSMKDDLRYTPSDCFETFPFPEGWESAPALEAVGREYYDFRADLMVRNDEGLTKIYNRFHDPDNFDPDIVKLRELHTAMDRFLLEAYGWSDVPTSCEFLPDFEVDEDQEDLGHVRTRYRWPDDVRDEVLGRLLKLNAERAAEERRSGAAASAARAPHQRAGSRGRKPTGTGELFA